jgi:conjugal transfer pilus assembly protein TrbC
MRQLLALVGLSFGAVWAQATSPAWPTEHDMQQALQARPLPSAQRLQQVPPTPIPRIDGNSPQPMDFNALARQGSGLLGAPAHPEPESGMRIFVTLDMPRPSLERLVDQAARSGAVLVLRGLRSQSMRQTLNVVQDLIGQRRVAWVIDPEAFDRFGVHSAPTFVLTLNGDSPKTSVSSPMACSASGCVQPPESVSVVGDVSLDHALSVMARQFPRAAPRVQDLLSRLQRS